MSIQDMLAFKCVPGGSDSPITDPEGALEVLLLEVDAVPLPLSLLPLREEADVVSFSLLVDALED